MKLNISKIEKQAAEYEKEFDESDYMDIETHTSMALQVSPLLAYIRELEYALRHCGYHAQNIIERDYGKFMDAHEIIEEVNGILGDENE